MRSSSSALSKAAESLPPGWMMGNSFLMSSPNSGGGENGLARVHPVDVAAQGVDFAVVRDVAERVRQLPGGKRVGGEALVHQAERADHFRIAQLGIKAGDLRREQQSFIYDGAGGQRGHVEETLVVDIGGGDFRFGALADDVEFALQVVLVHAPAAAQENLLDVRLRIAGHAADGGAVDGGVAPAEHGEALFADDALDDALALQARGRLDRQKRHAHAVFPTGREGEAQARAFAHKKFVWNLNEHPGAVARFRVAAAGAAVRQVDQDLDPFFDNVVGLAAIDVAHETDAAGVMFLPRIIKPLGWRETTAYTLRTHGDSEPDTRDTEGNPIGGLAQMAVALG